MPRATVITVSDSCAHGEREDVSGPEACRLLRDAGYEVAAPCVVPDDRPAIAAALREAAARSTLVVTTGGTGLAARDVTPEATLDVLEREAPGIAEHLRASRPRRHPARPALARPRGPPRRLPDREPARQSEGRAQRPRRRSCRCSRTSPICWRGARATREGGRASGGDSGRSAQNDGCARLDGFPSHQI